MLGTMSIPDPMDAGAACEALDYFYASGFNEVDTAIIYQGGKTEATLGKDFSFKAYKHRCSEQQTVSFQERCIRTLE